MSDDFEVITPPVRRIAFRGEPLDISPLTLAQVGPFITATRPIIGRVLIAASMAGVGGTIEVAALMMDILEQDGAAFARAAAIVTGRPEEWVAGGSLADVAGLTEAVVELNEDFFGQRLPSLLMAASKAIPTAVATQARPDGQTSSTT